MSAGSTYTPIATYTAPSAQASYTFTSIPQTYTDLVLIYQTRASSQNVYIDVVGQVNGDTGSNYSFQYMSGDGSSPRAGYSSSPSRMIFDSNGAPWNSYWAIGRINFMSYTNAKYKTVLSRTDNAGGSSGGADFVMNLWKNTAAITSIKIYLDGGYNLDAGTTLTLYGIAAA